jgi:hypothetical protein
MRTSHLGLVGALAAASLAVPITTGNFPTSGSPRKRHGGSAVPIGPQGPESRQVRRARERAERA